MKHPWLAWYPGDYLSKTRYLTMAQHGAYLLLLWEYYINGPIPAHAEQVFNICSAHDPQKQADVDFILTTFFTLRRGRYHHKRADVEISKREDIRTKRVKAGHMRKQKTSTCSLQDEQMPTQSQPQSQPQESRSKSLRLALPSLGEITAYCQERGNKIDPQQWFDYYTSNGWRVGRSIMRDWRAAVRTWERNGFNSKGSKANENNRQASAVEQRVSGNREVLADLARTITDQRVRPDGDELQDSVGTTLKRGVRAGSC